MPLSVTKDPIKARAGRLGAERRWAEHLPAIVKIDDLNPDQRLLVLALVRAARAADAKKAVSAATAETAQEVDRANRSTPTASE